MVISAAQNGQTTNYTYGLERISAITGKTRTEYVYDGRGSVAAEVSYNDAWYTFGGGLARKNVTAKSYTPFGEQIGEQASGFGYNGEYYNAATGMIYLRARFYEPEMNRFGQKDILRGSITDGISLNRYLYCQNDPVDYCDPSGMIISSKMSVMSDGGGSGRSSTSNQTTPIVTKPGKNGVSSANAASRTVAVPVTDTGTGGYRSSYSATRAFVSTKDDRDNQSTQTGTSQTSGITQASPSVQNVTGNRGYSCGRDINALGAGDYHGIDGLFELAAEYGYYYMNGNLLEDISDFILRLAATAKRSGGVLPSPALKYSNLLQNLLSFKNLKNNLQQDNSDFSTQGKIINDQGRDTGEQYEYGAFSASYNMCEVIAMHNARVLLNQDSTLSETAFLVQSTGAMTPSGIFGSNPYMLGDALNAVGIDSIPVNLDEMTEEGIYIISFWNNSSVLSGIHTVAVDFSDGVYTTYNYFGDGSEINRDPSTFASNYVYGYYLGKGED